MGSPKSSSAVSSQAILDTDFTVQLGAVFACGHPGQWYSQLARFLGVALNASHIAIVPSKELLEQKHKMLEWSAEGNPAVGSDSVELALTVQRHCLWNARTVRSENAYRDFSTFDDIPSNGSDHLTEIPIKVLARTSRHIGMPLVTLIAYRKGVASPPWDEQECSAFDAIVAKVGSMLAMAISDFTGTLDRRIETFSSSFSKAEAETALTPLRSAYERLVQHSDAIIFNTTPDFIISFISNRSNEFFGVPPEHFIGTTEVHWFDLVHLEDRPRVSARIAELIKLKQNFDEECRVVNHITGVTRWLLVKFTPVIGTTGILEGWDGFAVDISKHREAQLALDAQSKKVRALYTVSSAIRGYLDPANIAARGLAALCEATTAEAGLCYLFPMKDEAKAELVAHFGFSREFSQAVEKEKITSRPRVLPGLSSLVVEQGEAVVIPDLRTDPRASRDLAEQEGMRSALIVPITVEDKILGTLELYDHQTGKFGSGDVMLVSAASNQIGLAARQANLFSAYRKQTKNLAALYRLSHELTGSQTLDQVFQTAFSIIRDELAIKRMWLGLLNETGTRVIGQAAFGPGWKRRLVEINVEIAGRDHPIAEVVTSRQPRVIDDPDKILKEFGVRRFFSRFSISSVGLVPLISVGQVLGVLVFQPSGEQDEIDKEEISLVGSLASEIAAVVLSKRLEQRVSDADKMRAAGLLAAGIAHNFNNLLQAILGQASLLEMQSSNKEQVSKSVQTINESAAKGATLVRHLMSFAHLEEPTLEVCDVTVAIERSMTSLSRNLKPGQTLKLSLGQGLPRAEVDSSQLLRILLALVANASEASEEGQVVEIFSDSIVIDKSRPHYEIPYGEYVRVGVRDYGIGMDEETKRRCFEPFFTTKNLDPSSGLSLSGAGLGLAAAFALARKNGGRLVVESRKGQGSVFTLYMAVVRAGVDKRLIPSTQQSQNLRTTVGVPPSSMSESISGKTGAGSQVRELKIEKIRTPIPAPSATVETTYGKVPHTKLSPSRRKPRDTKPEDDGF